MLKLVFVFVVRLLTASVTPASSVTVPALVKLMTTSFVAPGTWPPTQFVPRSQLPPLGSLVLSHKIVDSTRRSSRPSTNGLMLKIRRRFACWRDFDALRLAWLRRDESNMVSEPVADDEEQNSKNSEPMRHYAPSLKWHRGKSFGDEKLVSLACWRGTASSRSRCCSK